MWHNNFGNLFNMRWSRVVENGDNGQPMKKYRKQNNSKKKPRKKRIKPNKRK